MFHTLNIDVFFTYLSLIPFAKTLNSPTMYGISRTSKTILNSPLFSLDASDLSDSLSLSVVSAVKAAAYEYVVVFLNHERYASVAVIM